MLLTMIGNPEGTAEVVETSIPAQRPPSPERPPNSGLAVLIVATTPGFSLSASGRAVGFCGGRAGWTFRPCRVRPCRGFLVLVLLLDGSLTTDRVVTRPSVWDRSWGRRIGPQLGRVSRETVSFG